MKQSKNLDGSSFTYTYPELGTVKIDFYDGLLKYEWIAGPHNGTKGDGSAYMAKKINENSYFINWLEKSNSSFVTLAIDIDLGIVHASALINPRTDGEMVLFHDADIATYTLKEH